MKVTQRTLLAFAATLVFGLGACSDDDPVTPPSGNTDYAPTTTGSYWVYEKHNLDSAGNTTTQGMTTDSTVVGSQTTINNQTAYQITTYSDSSGNKTTSTGYMYSKDSKSYEFKSLSDYFPPIMARTVRVNSRWVLAADFTSNASWNLIDTTVQDIQFEFSGTQVTVGGNVKITAKNTGMKTINYKGVNTQAQEITSSSLFTLTASGLPVPPFTITKRDYYVANVGLVQSTMDSQNVPVPFLGNYTLTGKSKTLVRTSLK
jgi:hypothetical protein